MSDLAKRKGNACSIAIQMRYISPWREIYDRGQYPTWITSALANQISVYRLEAETTNRIQDAIDSFLDTRRHGATLGVLVRFVLRLADKLLPRSRPKWAVEEGTVPIIRERSPAMLMLHHRRNIALLGWFAAERSEPFLFRTNSSSFVNALSLSEYVSTLDPNKPLVGGVFAVDAVGRRFLSGAGLLLSRAAVKVLYEARVQLRRDLPEDVAISLLAQSLDIEIVQLRRIDLGEDFDSCTGSFRLSDPDIFHFRCKSTSRPDGDVLKMLAVSKAVARGDTDPLSLP